MQTSPLDGLHDVIVPSQVSWWPLAPIWWVIIATLLLAIGYLSYTLYRAYQFKKAKRHAILLSNQYDDDAQQLHILIKRLVLHYYAQSAASQGTKQWCNTLNKLTGQQFTELELMSLYQEQSNQTALATKLKLAIAQFKLKEPLNV
ncbi:MULTISPECIES: DUF4381 domain-containing protein [Pseudoalteromonas]|uniref:DUF4381 domain-containing protein n=1 Tax=Pseudoalteromonas prydzensis TaxID=182141 RepID=A0ABR9FPI2_9GAMM|nr:MULTISPECIES: DUF4381 domain-containing protein [Pseudoalteromonas]MBE0379774.1 hypothetical protein [Pseudoalteromonas prydzensis ACAM 620]MBE0458726.1 DUF4381 domain-containing protein [Pseudoalteromonas prydzensis]WKD24569.1 DUF4381 domain-containing protein [Pseudoalteromonas sp. KG3]